MALITKTVNECVDAVLNRFLAAQDQVTDISPGSILRVLVESICFEIGTNPSEYMGLNLYDQLINVYNSGFIDLAEGIPLDRLVSILGVTRTGSVSSSSTVTFRRNTPAVSDITIPAGSRVSTTGEADQPSIVFETAADATFFTSITNERHTFSLSATPLASEYIYEFDEKHVNSIVQVVGTSGGAPTTFTAVTDYALITEIDGTNRIEWETTGTLPDNNTDFFIDYVPLSKDISVISVEGGSDKNVGALTINVRVDVPLGIESVINYVSASGGQDIESDESLRIRAKNQLSVLSKATLAALRFAILSVEGVNDVQIDDLPVTRVYNESQRFNFGDAYTSLNESPVVELDVVEALKTETVTYNTGSNTALTNTPVTELVTVYTDEATPTYFVKGTDYQLTSNEIEWIGSTPTNGQDIVVTYYTQLEEDVDYELNFDKKNIKWLAGTLPDDGTYIRVQYTYRSVGIATALVLANVIPLTQALKDSIEAKIEETRAAGIQVNITEPTVQTIDVEMNLYLSVGAPADALTQIEDNVTSYINGLSLGEDVIQSEIVFQAQRVAGVFDVVVTDPAANIAIPIDIITRAGVITINVI
jgi:uncharacterized phage protein gp47/JayE